MRAQRIKTGFRRIAIAGALICAIPGAVMTAIGIYLGVLGNVGWDVPMLYGILWFLGAAAIFVTARTLGWIIAGFAGDGEISN